eukprot:6177426-Pleurochrysis_carterae.AAC.2
MLERGGKVRMEIAITLALSTGLHAKQGAPRRSAWASNQPSARAHASSVPSAFALNVRVRVRVRARARVRVRVLMHVHACARVRVR